MDTSFKKMGNTHWVLMCSEVPNLELDLSVCINFHLSVTIFGNTFKKKVLQPIIITKNNML
ncbi:MAG: hypothetical protein DSY83_18025 [Flavobacteriia bacterium]|nr:MAG: hypothetical protein DSY83_18025 [Flavobacteriia bacterium]